MARVAPTTTSDQLALWCKMAEAEIDALPAELVMYKNSTGVRCCIKYVCLPVACSPCILYSCMFRLLCCIPSCGESIGGGCCGVYVTKTSDNCLTAPIKVADEQVYRPTFMSRHIEEVGAKEMVWAVFDKLLCKMEASKSPKDQYKMMDWLLAEAINFGLFIKSSTTTPQNARSVFSAALGMTA